MLEDHVCCVSQNSINATPHLNAFKKRGQGFFHRIYMNRENILPKAKDGTGEITVNVKRLRKTFGAYGGVALNIKRTVKDSQWHCALLVLVAEECGWY